jgi:hypothetical protein
MEGTADMSEKALTAWEAAGAWGVDLWLLEENLDRTPNERVRAHEEALRLIEEMERAFRQRQGEKRDEGHGEPPSPPVR